MSKIIVLGAGMVGSAMAKDLAQDHNVLIADRNKDVLVKVAFKSPQLKAQVLDVTDKSALSRAIQEQDLVICAVPGFLGYQTLQSIIEAGKDVVDISCLCILKQRLDGRALIQEDAQKTSRFGNR